MPMASLRNGESRVARNAKPNGENTITRKTVTASAAMRAPASRNCRAARPFLRPDSQNALSPPVTATHWNAIDHTICANASVSIAK